MLWCDFYDRFWEWADSTRRTRISELEDIGSGEEIVECVLEISDEKVRVQLIRKAIKLGADFSYDDFMELDGALPAELYEQLEQYADFDHHDPYFDVNTTQWDTEAFVSDREKTQRKNQRVSFWAVLTALFSGLDQLASEKKHSHRCDGDCDHCPAHYGYRYGRWYYGHGHQYGCQRGGNGGATGRTYRD